jgi:hypothetical protein
MLEGKCHCGAVSWTFTEIPPDATVCNCTICRRYGALWAYDYEGEKISVAGPTRVYVRGPKSPLAFHFCETCGCVVYWRLINLDEEGRRRIAVNLRLTEQPDAVATIPIEHFDGLDTFEDLGGDGRCVRDYWS